ncbi:glycosyltransferase, partial [Akkermansiaceae bacterium]|nr:glycosyltransferase [Akkermansiaceae bacterium]
MNHSSSPPDFTIISPSYNYAQYIEEMLESVARQEGVTFEHLVFDAGSTDGTLDILKRYPHVDLVVESDKGMSDAINKGFKKAKGRWVMWLNTDDRLKPDALQAALSILESESFRHIDFGFGSWDFIGEKGEYIKTMKVCGFDRKIMTYHGCYVGSTSCFMRRETTMAEGHLLDEDLKIVMDAEYYLRCFDAGKRFKVLPISLADFRLHGDNASQSYLSARIGFQSFVTKERSLSEGRAVRRFFGYRFPRNAVNQAIPDSALWYLMKIKKGFLKMVSPKPVDPTEYLRN